MNQDIRQMIKDAGLKQWQVAKKCGISEYTFIRWLREELETGKKAIICKAIHDLQKEGRVAS